MLAWFTDLMGGTAIQTYTGAETALLDVALSPDRKLLAAVGEYGTIALFDLTNHSLRKRWQGHTEVVYQVVFHPQETWFATAGEDQRIVFWSLPEGEKLREWIAPNSVHTITLSPDGTHLASGGADSNVTIWDVATGSIMQTLQGHSDIVETLAFSPDGGLLASASFDQTAKIWEVATGKSRLDLRGHINRINDVIFHPDGQLLATSSDDRTIRLWDVTTGESINVLTGHKSEVNGLVFVDQGQYLVSSGCDRAVRIWHTASGVTVRVLQGHTALVAGVTADDLSIYSASADQTIRQWDLQPPERQQVMQIMDVPSKAVAVALAPDGSCFAVGFADGALRLYQLPDRQMLWEQRPADATQSKPLYHVVFSPDSKLLATANNTNQFQFWRVADGKLLQTIEYSHKVSNVSFAPDGTMIAVITLDGYLGLFQLHQPEGRYQQVHKQEAHEEGTFKVIGFVKTINTDI